jgi:PPOX class probable F420-dependent enzyme
VRLDTSTEFGARVARRLAEEEIIWLTTVSPAGRPLPSPVWFLWEQERLLIYSQPGTPKLRNVALNPAVSLHFNSDHEGGDVVILAGRATFDPNQPPADDMPPYLAKYRAAIERIGMTPTSFAESYSEAIWVVPEGVRGF